MDTAIICAERIVEYIGLHFNVTGDHLNSLEEVYYALDRNCYELDRFDMSAESDRDYCFKYIPAFWEDFCSVCKAGNIDVDEKDLYAICDMSFE